MCLFRYAVHPQCFETDGIIAELAPQKKFLALDENGEFHKEMSIGELAGCTHKEDTRFCSTALLEKGPDTCLAVLNFKMYDKASELCSVKLHKKDPYLYQYNSSHYPIFSTKHVPYTITCADNMDPNDEEEIS